MKKHYFSLLIVLINSVLVAQTITFSDAAFKTKLLQSDANSTIARSLSDDYFAIDVNKNGQIEEAEALQVAHLDIQNASITSLSGIEKFTNLVSLHCGNNEIVNLNVGSLVKLTDLNCSSNTINTLTLTGANSIQNLYCQSNKLTSLSVNNFTTLVTIDCSDNLIASVDFSSLINLETLFCNTNAISSLNVDDLINLITLECDRNKLSTLNLSKLDNITSLSCNFNQLSSLNVSSLTELTSLNCTNNLLTSLTVNGLTKLSSLNCNQNKLTSVSLNTLAALTFFNCTNNNLQTLLLGGLAKLRVLNFSNNQITFLDTLGLTNLQFLTATNNKLVTLDATNQIGLQNLIISNNLLTSLYLKNGSAESSLSISGNANLSYICADESDIETIQEEINNNGYTNCFVNSYCSFVPGGNYYTIEGKNKLDSNKNGCNAFDNNFPNLKMVITDDSSGTTFISDSTGNYNYNAKQGSYTITPVLENPSYYNISPSSTTVVFPDVTSPFLAPFCITPKGNLNDLEIILLPIENARSNFDCTYRIVYKNKGTVTRSGVVNLGFSATDLSYVSANPSVSSQSSSNLIWNFTNLLPQETRTIVVNLKVKPSLADGYLLNFVTTITNNTDETPNDNRADLSQTVVSAISLNDKICLEGNAVSPIKVGDYLHYIIRFENSGSDLISNIVLKDLIDTSKFDIETLVPLSGSHPYYTRILANSAVEFILENIDLPINTSSNKGYVAFKIKTLPGLVNGNELTNAATLYFDYQKPLNTNIATTAIQALEIQDPVFSDFFTIYPNPVKNNLNIMNRNQIQIGSISIYNMLGQLVQTFVAIDSTSALDVSQLKAGFYAVKINAENASTTLKFIKE